MTELEVKKAMNEFIALFPNYYKNTGIDQLQRIAESWKRKFADIEYNDFVEVLYQYDAESDYNTPPTTKTIIAMAKKLKNSRLNRSYERRIMTPEEDCSNEYIEIMENIKNGKSSLTQELKDYLLRLKPYYLLFNGDGWEERYIKHFGKPRNEFEKL